MIGTTTGVATLADGTYVLPVPASAGEHPVLTFTYIGYESLNVTVGKNHVVNAKLKPEVVIDQIVVTGFKTQRKRVSPVRRSRFRPTTSPSRASRT